MQTSKQLQVSSTIRGLLIGGCLLVYAYVTHQPGISLGKTFLVAVGVQVAVLVARFAVPEASRPKAMYTIETLADGITVLLFTLSVLFGTMPRDF